MYEKFTKSLASKGYKMNQYDPCVWNKVINGKQCTILFHNVDDCKISHVDSESIFEDGRGKMKVHHHGKIHKKHLGMTLR